VSLSKTILENINELELKPASGFGKKKPTREEIMQYLEPAGWSLQVPTDNNDGTVTVMFANEDFPTRFGYRREKLGQVGKARVIVMIQDDEDFESDMAELKRRVERALEGTPGKEPAPKFGTFTKAQLAKALWNGVANVEFADMATGTSFPTPSAKSGTKFTNNPVYLVNPFEGAGSGSQEADIGHILMRLDPYVTSVSSPSVPQWARKTFDDNYGDNVTEAFIVSPWSQESPLDFAARVQTALDAISVMLPSWTQKESVNELELQPSRGFKQPKKQTVKDAVRQALDSMGWAKSSDDDMDVFEHPGFNANIHVVYGAAGTIINAFAASEVWDSTVGIAPTLTHVTDMAKKLMDAYWSNPVPKKPSASGLTTTELYEYLMGSGWVPSQTNVADDELIRTFTHPTLEKGVWVRVSSAPDQSVNTVYIKGPGWDSALSLGTDMGNIEKEVGYAVKAWPKPKNESVVELELKPSKGFGKKKSGPHLSSTALESELYKLGWTSYTNTKDGDNRTYYYHQHGTTAILHLVVDSNLKLVDFVGVVMGSDDTPKKKLEPTFAAAKAFTDEVTSKKKKTAPVPDTEAGAPTMTKKGHEDRFVRWDFGPSNVVYGYVGDHGVYVMSSLSSGMDGYDAAKKTVGWISEEYGTMVTVLNVYEDEVEDMTKLMNDDLVFHYVQEGAQEADGFFDMVYKGVTKHFGGPFEK